MTRADATNTKPLPPYYAYVLGTAMIWTALMPIADWLAGDWSSPQTSVVKVGIAGLGWGLAIHPLQLGLRRRNERQGQTSAGPRELP